jgi:hypothetical protein
MVELRRSLAREIGLLLAVRLDPSGTFLHQLPFEPVGRGEREIVYAALATGISPVGKACFLGDLASCRSLVGLIESPDAVSVWSEPVFWPERPPWTTVSFPKLVARRLLLDVALEVGGDGTYGRIATTSGSGVEQRLTAAARVEGDTLIARWREAVLNARPKTQAVGAFEGLAALVWVLGLVFLATRSSRWRSA